VPPASDRPQTPPSTARQKGLACEKVTEREVLSAPNIRRAPVGVVRENSRHLMLYLGKVIGTAEKRSAKCLLYRGADKSLARPTSLCILFDGENISFEACLVIYIYIYK
jgi:hypothetical protein